MFCEAAAAKAVWFHSLPVRWHGKGYDSSRNIYTNRLLGVEQDYLAEKCEASLTNC